jgi:hypothetical protein
LWNEKKVILRMKELVEIVDVGTQGGGRGGGEGEGKFREFRNLENLGIWRI